MKVSHFRHPLAVLRQIIGLGQKELARLVGLSGRGMIEQIENGRKRLSDDFAAKIAQETAVSAVWLLKGDPQAEPTTGLVAVWCASFPKIYDKRCYEAHRRFVDTKEATFRDWWNWYMLWYAERGEPGVDEALRALMQKIVDGKGTGREVALAKALSVFCQANALTDHDAGLLGVFRQILDQTAGGERAVLVRRKMGNLAAELMEKNAIALQPPPPIRVVEIPRWKLEAPPGWKDVLTSNGVRWHGPNREVVRLTALSVGEVSLSQQKQITEACAPLMPGATVTRELAPDTRVSHIRCSTMEMTSATGEMVEIYSLITADHGSGLFVTLSASYSPDIRATHEMLLKHIQPVKADAKAAGIDSGTASPTQAGTN